MQKILITGASGKMGKMLIQAVEQTDGVVLAGAIDRGDDLTAQLASFDVLIDFSRPEATLAYLSICAENLKGSKRIVIGTTGFNDEQIANIKQTAEKMPIVFAPNMSVGVNASFKLIELATQIIGNDADIEIVESHHRHKVDAPSGTALKMGEVVANALGRDLKQCAVYGRAGIDKPRDKQTIGFSTIRGGDVVGDHKVSFMMDGERLEIMHKASSRMTYAMGAVRAAKWLATKQNGLYTMHDVLGLK